MPGVLLMHEIEATAHHKSISTWWASTELQSYSRRSQSYSRTWLTTASWYWQWSSWSLGWGNHKPWPWPPGRREREPSQIQFSLGKLLKTSWSLASFPSLAVQLSRRFELGAWEQTIRNYFMTIIHLKGSCRKLVAVISPACSAICLLPLCHRSALGWCTLGVGAPSSCQNGASHQVAPSR